MSDDLETDERPGRGRLVAAVAAGLGVVALLAVMTVGLLNQERGNSIQRAVEANERPQSPDFELPALVGGGSIEEGGSVRLSELRGTPIVLNFWASWCVPCRTEAPVLERLWSRYRDRGLLVLGVNVQDLTGNAKQFDEEFGLSYPSVRDGDDSTMRDFEVTGVPETFVIDRQGRVAALRVGPVTAEEQLVEAIEAVL
ncbi:MAG: TlpA family protein disulfide reductase [Thermoleophilia bacterium]|nr:TlpA family protein disulfide reductase [Thermoleophilia bacterium]MDH3725118.1 TlpA family protein disulfide reductase [Thermoleophilia bacterium]